MFSPGMRTVSLCPCLPSCGVPAQALMAVHTGLLVHYKGKEGASLCSTDIHTALQEAVSGRHWGRWEIIHRGLASAVFLNPRRPLTVCVDLHYTRMLGLSLFWSLETPTTTSSLYLLCSNPSTYQSSVNFQIKISI